jgi:hypothetical protein
MSLLFVILLLSNWHPADQLMLIDEVNPDTTITRMKAGIFIPRDYTLGKKPSRLIDLTGQVFGKLTVIQRSDIMNNGRRPKWECQCECGRITVVFGMSLRRGKSRSCGGCDRIPEKHGEWASAEYSVWGGMKSRCSNPNNPHFKNYGGRGIKVCQEWDSSYVAFLAHVGRRPSDKHTIDRIDNDKGYEPGNVRWATRREQVLNRRNSVLLTFQGQTKCLADWALQLGFPITTLRSRIKNRWSVEELLSTPANPNIQRAIRARRA